MTSRRHQDWINRGRPDSGLARPLAQLRDLLRADGWTVYDFPNDAHLDAEPPEDHTYYSETGWPIPSPKWWRHAIDIMPLPGPDGAAKLYDLGNKIYLDRAAGKITWLKYMNTPAWRGKLDQARQYRWEPGLKVGTSSDVGHIHLSSITGVETLDSPYDPFAVAAGEEGDMNYTESAKLTAIFDFKPSAALDPTKPAEQFPVALVQHIQALEKAMVDVSAALAKLAAQAPTQSSVPAGDYPVTGTLHIGPQASS